MKIGFFEIEGWEENIIASSLIAKDNEIIYKKEKIDDVSLPLERDLEIISIFVNCKINKNTLDHLPKLKLICTRSTGFDHIDLTQCKKRGILVSYVPGYGDNTVAEYTFGLLLNLSRKIYQSIDQIKEFGSFSLKDLRGVDLKNKTIGVIGTGRIGKEVIKIALGFSMNVIAFDPFPDNNFALQHNIKYVEFEQLLKNSDFITLHCPYNESTHHLLNKNNISLIKKGAYLINTARGPIVETESIVQALQDGILAGYASDVLEQESEIKDELTYLHTEFLSEEKLKTMLYDHILMKMPNVLITPHNAFNTVEALQRILNTTIDNISCYLNGKPVNIVGGT